MRDIIITATTESIKKITSPRYFKSERGYQGVFYCYLFNEFEKNGLLNEDRILEQEYQKSQRHGLGQRPDIIFHIPVEHSGAAINEHNYSVWALKANASKESALEDFDKLEEMIYHLKYPLGIFININSADNHLEHYSGKLHDNIIGFSVLLNENEVNIKKSCFENGELKHFDV